MASECVRRFFGESEHLHFKGAILPTHLRYQARLNYRMTDNLVDQVEIEFVGTMDNKKQAQADQHKHTQHILNEMVLDKEATDCVPVSNNVYPPFIQACVNGQLEMVQFMLNIYPVEQTYEQRDEKGRTALQCMEQDLDDEKRSKIDCVAITQLLKSNKRQKTT